MLRSRFLTRLYVGTRINSSAMCFYNHKRNSHTGKTYLKADEAIEMANSKVGSVEISLWISRINSREQKIYIKPTRRLPDKLRHEPFTYLAVSSPFRKVLDSKNYYHELLQKLQPDAIILAVEDTFRPYLTSPDPENLAHLNMSIFKMPSYIMKKGFFDGEYDRLYHKLLRVFTFHRNSEPYENYRTILSHSKDILGCKVYTGGRIKFHEIDMKLPSYSIELKLKLGWIWFNHFLTASVSDFCKYTYELTQTRNAIDNNPFFILNNITKCFNLMASVNHVKVELRDKMKKIKQSDPSLQNLPDEPVILLVAPPRISDILLKKSDFYSLPAVDIDREDLELYELIDTCLDSPHLIKNDFLKQLKYKSSLVPPLIF